MINYSSKSKGKTYRYFKFIHPNGVVHYLRKVPESTPQSSSDSTGRIPISDAILEILDSKTLKGELRFSEIKRFLEELYGRAVSTATVYRNIDKLLKLDLIVKRNNAGLVYYGTKLFDTSTDKMKISKLSIGLDFSEEKASVTLFFHVTNMSIKLITKVPISIPVGVIDSLDSLDIILFNGIKRVTLGKENIAYSYPGQTAFSVVPSRPLHKLEEEDFLLNFSYRFDAMPIKINLLSDIDLLKVVCQLHREKEIEIKKRLVDGVKEIRPVIVRRTILGSGYKVVEANFDNSSRGDTIIISLEQHAH